MSETQTSKFEGWAVVELFGHSREIGYVTTEYFGSGALFRIEVPPLPERETTLLRPQWIDDQFCDAGTKILRGAIEGRTRFVGPGAIYALNPCSKDAALTEIDRTQSREIKIVELVKRKELSESLQGEHVPEDEEYSDEGEEETVG